MGLHFFKIGVIITGMSTATFAASSPKVTPKPECKKPTTTTTVTKKAAGKSDKTADASVIPMLAEALLAGGAVVAGAKYKLTK